MASKVCRGCGLEKPITEFSPSGSVTKTGRPVLRSNCKECNCEYATQWWKDNRERQRAIRRRRDLMNMYGITPEQYEEMLARQDGGCGICGTRDPGAGHIRLPVDHDHVTGRVRGILCHSCNRAIGLLGDSIDRLKMAIKYLEGAE